MTNGVLIVTFGHEVNAAINGLTLTMTPYEVLGSVVWRCGNAPTPAGLNELGTAGGANPAIYIPPDGAKPVFALGMPFVRATR